MEKYTALLGDLWPEFRQTLREQLATDISLIQDIDEGLLSHAGKMLRPVLALLFARATPAACASDCIHVAAAAEILHNATLLHDDVADRSALRRGKPTLYAMMGAGPAVMMGDFWLASAVNCVMHVSVRDRIISHFARVLRLLSEGQLLELEKAQAPDAGETDYLRIIYCKTASLFETTCRCAAIAAGATQTQADAAATYGKALGMAFQIRDDIFDYGNSASVGKPVGIDLKEGKVTLPLIGALKNSGTSAREFLAQAGDFEATRNFVLENGGIEYATQRMNAYISQAVQALEPFPASPFRDALTEIADFAGKRQR
ncbi:MAG: polyprenyl synthetase family protein [Bacteroidales bacterium]|nr:polyprenyl synthetase family protein [Bacteroidales bacterium]